MRNPPCQLLNLRVPHPPHTSLLSLPSPLILYAPNPSIITPFGRSSFRLHTHRLHADRQSLVRSHSSDPFIHASHLLHTALSLSSRSQRHPGHCTFRFRTEDEPSPPFRLPIHPLFPLFPHPPPPPLLRFSVHV